MNHDFNARAIYEDVLREARRALECAQDVLPNAGPTATKIKKAIYQIDMILPRGEDE